MQYPDNRTYDSAVPHSSAPRPGRGVGVLNRLTPLTFRVLPPRGSMCGEPLPARAVSRLVTGLRLEFLVFSPDLGSLVLQLAVLAQQTIAIRL